MFSKLLSTLNWLPAYIAGAPYRFAMDGKVERIYFAICDHFEPYWNNVGSRQARQRLSRWLDCYPSIADRFHDCAGIPLKYSFFYPIEQYRFEDMELLARLCRAGYGEVEVHLHHDNDTSANLRATLLSFKKVMAERHGLLATDKITGDTAYGFIHGNWALDNCHPDQRWCGVNDEISILQQTGCFADFTLPSAPSRTQTRKINSLYYAVDDSQKPKSHDDGTDAEVGREGTGLLMIQGPLMFSHHNRKWGMIPRIENGGIVDNNPPSLQRIKLWVESAVAVKGAPHDRFVKIYTHGTQEGIMDLLFNGGLASLFEGLQRHAVELGAELFFTSAREMTNIVHALEAGCPADLGRIKNFRYVSNISHDQAGSADVPLAEGGDRSGYVVGL